MVADLELQIIGVVRSDVKERHQMPAFGAPAAVEIEPRFADGLFRIEKHSHFWVMAWLMAKPERDVLQVIPRGVAKDAPDGMHGVFAVRSPARPNPIGLTAAKLLRRHGLRLEFDLLDFLDGTPVLDLKPYFASRDIIWSAQNNTIGRPKDREALRTSLLFQAMRYCAAEHPEVAMAVRVMEHYRAEVAGWIEPVLWEITTPVDHAWFVDALMGMTRGGFSRGVKAGEHLTINGIRYDIRWGTDTFQDTMQKKDAELFQCSASS